MKKIAVLVALCTALIFTPFNTKATTAVQKDHKTIKQELQKFDKQTDSVELVYNLPKGTPTIKFDNVEEFKKAVADYEKASKNKKQNVQEYNDNTTPTSYTFLAASSTKTGTKRIRWSNAESLRWAYSVWLPHDMWIDFKYTYTGSGKSKKFKKVTTIKSDSSSFPSSWHQSMSNSSFYDKNRGVKIHIKGSFLLGVNIGGQSVGAKFPDSYTKKYHF
ncbi:hypothetical protein [Bacillus atrophaeus]|uniref:hypothetical protein n=1 Tax=Bacillus atrophaeus TaxID=1452 RepID=UPI000B927EBE|nr:hypothetical protein [Bacillus atrophaeus]ASS72392.1 hypothetical protein BaGK_16295 [Bacillus atrophaeus]